MQDKPKTSHTNDQLNTIFSSFLAANPLSKIKRIAIDREGTKQAVIEKPWGDASVAFDVPEDPTALSAILNDLRLPSRFSAIWHQDTKDFEVIWTAYALALDNEEVRHAIPVD